MMTPSFGRANFSSLQSTLVYLDTAATSQMPQQVLEAMFAYEASGRGNPWRGLHSFALKATQAYTKSRHTVAKFVGASQERLIFCKSTTESLNLVASSLAYNLHEGDEVLVTAFEHHANLLPWRELAKKYHFTVRYMPVGKNNSLEEATIYESLRKNTKVIAVTHVSNVTGVILPITTLVQAAKKVGAYVVVDGAQAVGHIPVSVDDLGIDAYAFGAHKMYGPMGIGALALSPRLFSLLAPLNFGGGMVSEVAHTDNIYFDDVRRFEAGSPNVTGAVGFAAACEYLTSLGLEKVQQHENTFSSEVFNVLMSNPRIQILGWPKGKRTGIFSFSFEGAHPHDVADILGREEIAVRAGYHCAQPFTRSLAEEGTVRVSLGVYNETSDIDRLSAGLKTVEKTLGL